MACQNGVVVSNNQFNTCYVPTCRYRQFVTVTKFVYIELYVYITYLIKKFPLQY